VKEINGTDTKTLLLLLLNAKLQNSLLLAGRVMKANENWALEELLQ